MRVQQLGMPADLGFCIEAAARVIEIHVPLVIEPPVLGSTEPIESARGGILRAGFEEPRIGRALPGVALDAS
jgi:hypothetical protein